MRTKQIAFQALALLALVFCLPASAVNASGTITACNTTIPSTSTGIWTVTANITYTGTANCITVDASNITINLNGFTVKSTNSSPGEGIVIGSSSISNLTIEGGVLQGFSTGIDTSANTTNALTQIRNVVVRNSTGDGVDPGNILIISNSSFLNNGGYGVNGPSANGSLVVNSIACGNPSGGFNLPTSTGDAVSYFSPVSTSGC